MFHYSIFIKLCKIGNKSHDPCSHKKDIEAEIMIFVTYCKHYQTTDLISYEHLQKKKWQAFKTARLSQFGSKTLHE